MSEAEASIVLDRSTAVRLILEQFPELSGRDIRPLTAKGTDNHIFRIGEYLCARFPRAPWAAQTAEREAAALPLFADAPLAVPSVYGLGKRAEGYPHAWSVLSWLPGEPMEDSALRDPQDDAVRLAGFFRFVRILPADPAFRFSAVNNGRGAPLASRSERFDAALKRLPGLDDGFARRLWERAVQAGPAGDPVWLHGDVHPGNVLVEDGRVSGVIDWGLCGVGDGACDLLTAWAMFDRAPREAFRKALGATDSEWLRGAGWALSMAVIYLPYAYEHGLRSDMSEKTIERLREEFT